MKPFIFLSIMLSVVMLSGCTTEKTNLVSSQPLMPNGENYQPVEQLAAYYALWKDGDRVENPGYVKAFLLPEPVKLPWEAEGTDMGAVVLMVPNGTADELPGEYCVSTDEAMGYGMIIAALMDDQVLFDALLRVVTYYENKSNANLSLWAVPAKRGADWFETEHFKSLTQEAQDQWRTNGVQFDPLYENGAIVGESKGFHIAGGSATDGEIDIAYALYLAHSQWEAQSQGYPYLELARARFGALMTHVVGRFGEHENGTLFLPTGDYTVAYTTPNGYQRAALTRPCDFMTAQFRTYYEDVKSPQVIELIEALYDQTQALADPDTGLVPDFAYWDKDNLIPCPDEVSNEWMSAYFYMNAARFPFRMAMDTMHYGDVRGKNNALKIVDTFIAKYGDASPAAIHALDGEAHPSGLWANPVLDAGLFASAAMSGEAKYQAYVNRGWTELSTSFDSRHYDWDGNGLGLDPYHSGYFGDTWRLMAMLSMSGNWERPIIHEK